MSSNGTCILSLEWKDLKWKDELIRTNDSVFTILFLVLYGQYLEKQPKSYQKNLFKFNDRFDWAHFFTIDLTILWTKFMLNLKLAVNQATYCSGPASPGKISRYKMWGEEGHFLDVWKNPDFKGAWRGGGSLISSSGSKRAFLSPVSLYRGEYWDKSSPNAIKFKFGSL